MQKINTGIVESGNFYQDNVSVLDGEVIAQENGTDNS